MKTLCEIEQNKEYIISKVKAIEPVLSRLMSMGFTKGSKITLLKNTAGKQTFQVKIEDSEVGLRAEEAKLVFVKADK